MKYLKALLAPAILSLALLFTSGCGKKETGPTAAEVAAIQEAEAAEAAAAEAEALAAAEAQARLKAEALAAREAEEKAKAIAEAEALALALAAQKAEEEARAAAEVKAEAERQAKAKAEAEAKAKAEAEAKAKAAAMAKAKAEADAKAKAEADAKAKAAAEARAATKAKAAALYAEHQGKFNEFVGDTVALSNLIDKNPKKVSVQVADNLLDMRASMPSLEAEFTSLKDYEGDDLDKTVAEIKEDFDLAHALYESTLALLPEKLRNTLN